MYQFTKSDLQSLIEQQAKPKLSIYMPTHRSGSEVQQNPIRFKNLLKTAEDRLVDQGLRGPEAEEFLEQAQNQLLVDPAFWQQQSDGLALFIAPDLFQSYRLPVNFEEAVDIGDHFNIKPLFALLQNEGRFFILALSQDHVRLLEGTKGEVEEVNIDRMPTSLAEALQWDDPERQLQHREVNRGGGAQGRAEVSFHGHGVGKDDEKTDILRFFQILDKGLQDFLAGEQAPVILAGVEYLFPIYREANSYNHLVEAGIPGNPQDLSAETLHAHAWKLLSPMFEKEQQDAVALYQQQAGMETGRASHDLVEILQAAYGGRVGQLFIQESNEIWGKYDLTTNQVKAYPERTEDSEDLANTAAIFTFQNSGEVYILPQEEMPDAAPIAAVFRY